MLGGGQRDGPVDGLDLGVELITLAARLDLDDGVRPGPLQVPGLPGFEFCRQAGRATQAGEGALQHLPVLGHGAPCVQLSPSFKIREQI